MSDEDQILTDEQIATVTNVAREIGAAMVSIAQHSLNAYADLARAAAEFGVELRRTTNWIGGEELLGNGSPSKAFADLNPDESLSAAFEAALCDPGTQASADGKVLFLKSGEMMTLPGGGRRLAQSIRSGSACSFPRPLPILRAAG